MEELLLITWFDSKPPVSKKDGGKLPSGSERQTKSLRVPSLFQSGSQSMKRIVAILLMVGLLGACTPVVDPARWDSTMYCKTVQQAFGPDHWCRTHGH